MEDPIVFDRLVEELDDQERRALLVRVQGSAPIYSEPLEPEEQPRAVFIPEEELGDLNLLERITLFFKTLFSHRDREKLLEERYLKRLAYDIERNNPGLISADGCQGGMYEELLVLRAHARRLYAPLEEVLAKHRREFIAFLARNDLRDFQERLAEETDPQNIWENRRFTDEKKVRSVMLQRFHELVDSIPPLSKRQIGRDAQIFFSLYTFSRHPFDDLLSPFRGDKNPRAAVKDMIKPLKELAACLESLRRPPSAQALYDLFLFLHQERLEDQEFDLENQLTEDMSGVHAALRGIRRFREGVPLVNILRLINRDPDYIPPHNPITADWFSFFKDYWRQWVHHRYLEFYQSRKRSALVTTSHHFLAVKVLPGLANYREHKFGRNTPVRYELSLMFIKGFFQTVFLPFTRSLKLIYLNGEFYKEENRRAYTDAFLFLSETGKKIEEIESSLGPQGDLRGAIQSVKGQTLGERLRRKRILDILARADGQAKALVDAFLEQVDNLKDLLYGILKGQPGDRYDSLVNLSKIGGRENSELRQSWSQAMEKCDQAAAILKEIRELEANR